MKKGTTTFLKVAIFMVGMIVLALCTLWLPGIANGGAEMNPEYVYLRLPILLGINITTIPFYLALYQAFKLLKYIDTENAFSTRSVLSLGQIKNYAIAIIVLYAIGMILLVIQNALHPSIAIIGLVIIFATLVIAFFAAVLQELLKSALEIKAENDLTI